MFNCSQITYDRPQPVRKKEFKAIPNKFLGTYTSNENDTLLITSTNIMKVENGIMQDISNEIVVKKYNGFYIFNLRIANQWIVYLCKEKNGIIQLYCVNPSVITLGKLEVITEVLPLLNDEYLIHPTKKEFKEVMKLYKSCLVFTPLN